jgi:uncharacterized repeat protein (TIGR01451 family)
MSVSRTRRVALVLLGALALLTGLAGTANAQGQADLAVDKTASAESVTVGKRLVYLITVQNLGPDTATDVNLVDGLPVTCSEFGCRPVVRLLKVDPSQGSCGTEAEGNIPCTLGDIASGETVTVKIVVRTTQAGTITNSAFATTLEFDPDPSNDRDSVTTVVVAR